MIEAKGATRMLKEVLAVALLEADLCRYICVRPGIDVDGGVVYQKSR